MDQQNLSTYDRILNAAARLFAQKGYDGTTTREIVKEAGASLSSLQFHFQSKECIYRETVERAVARQYNLLRPDLDEIDAMERQGMLHGDTVWDLIAGLLGKLTDWAFLEEERNGILLMNREMLDTAPMMDQVPSFSLDILRGFQKLCETYAGAKDTLWAKTLSHFVIMMLFNIANYPRVISQIIQRDATDPEQARLIKAITKDYLLTSVRGYLDTRRADPKAEAIAPAP